MNIKEALKRCNLQLSQNDIIAPDFNAGVLVCFALNCTKTWLYTNLNCEIQEDVQMHIFNLIKRRIKGEPLQYIVGETGFMDLVIKVAPGILIPRSDTEILVETAVEILKDNKEIRFLDMCTGSGCIAASIALMLPEAHGDAVDISETCIEYARINCENAGVIDRVNIFTSDYFENIEFREYNIIVSNPPYIPTKIIEGLTKEVKDYEPLIALDGGENGLIYIEKIVGEAYDYLISGGLLMIEIGYDQLDDVVALMKEKYISVQSKKDYGGNNRIVYGYKS